MQCYWRLFRQATHGVQIVVWIDNQVLLVRNSYRAGYTFPGGHINHKETTIQAAVRELREETGVLVSSNQLQEIKSITYFRSGVLCSETLFKCQLKNMPEIIIDNREIIESRFASITEFDFLPLQNTTQEYLSICSQNTLSTYQGL
jgi:8-oxo-dGTP pyrophosphatase MutT (NUDIX family)